VELSVKERLVLVNILDAYQGNPISVGILSKLKDKLLITEEEADKFGVEANDEGMISWTPNIPNEVEIYVSPRAVKTIAERLDKMGKEEQLTLDHASLCTKFLGDDEEDG